MSLSRSMNYAEQVDVVNILYCLYREISYKTDILNAWVIG